MHTSMPAMLVADSPGLDFLNSVATPIDTPVDCLHNGAGLLDWLTQTQLVPEGVLSRVRKQSTAAELDAVAAQARELREWFRSFVVAHKGKPLQAADLRDLKPLNRLLERDEAFTQIVADAPSGPSKLRLESRRRWRAPGTLLLPIAEAMARLITTEDFSALKACEGPACTLLFADHTRGRQRRWCSMALCGNRAKQAAHRERLKRGR